MNAAETALFVILAAKVSTTANFTDVHLTSPPALTNWRLPLSSYDDQFYAIRASLGTPPQNGFFLTVSLSFASVIVLDSLYPALAGKRKFNSDASTTFVRCGNDDTLNGWRCGRDVMNLSTTGIWVDPVPARMDIPWSPNKNIDAKWEFEILRLQPFDGLFGLNQVYQTTSEDAYPYTMQARKTCADGLVRDVGGSVFSSSVMLAERPGKGYLRSSIYLSL